MPEGHRQISSMHSNEAVILRSQMEQMENVEEGALIEAVDQFDETGVAQFENHHQVDGDVYPYSIYAPQTTALDFSAASNPNQLTLSFHGQVLVFDDVSTEKVQSVILLLGGSDVTSGVNISAIPQNHRSVSDMYGRAIQPKRAAALSRFRKKKKDRCFDKKILYSVRKEVANRMKRRKGQFVSSKASSDDMGSGSSDGNASLGAAKEEHETSCLTCGTSSEKTPMMRRGPDGPRTLCNACGLKWANKVLHGKCPRNQVSGSQDPSSSAVIHQTAGEMNIAVTMPK